MAADFKALSKFDQGALVAGAVAILFSFFDAFVTASVKGSGDFAVNTSAGPVVCARRSVHRRPA